MYMKDFQNKVIRIFLPLVHDCCFQCQYNSGGNVCKERLIIHVKCYRDMIQVRQYHGTMCQAMVLDNVTV